MKKLLFVISIVGALSFASCANFVDGYDVSPNDPKDVGLSLLLPAAEVGIQTCYTSALDRNSSILVQQLAGTKEQMLEVAAYVLREGDNTNDWNNIYTTVIQTSNNIILKAGTENPYYAGIAKVIKAMGLGLATDTWGDIPAKEAGMGMIDGNLTPKFEAQKDVLAYIQTTLDEAISLLSVSSDKNKLLPKEDDFLYSGNAAQWKNLAYIIKARYANRLNKKDPKGSAADVIKNLDNVSKFSNFSALFGTGSTENNQWFAFENARSGYLKTGEYFVNKLKSLSDPRLPFYVAKDDAGQYSGSPANFAEVSASSIGPYVNAVDAPINIVSNAEILFLYAEANFRLEKKDLAASYYNSAVKEAIKMVTGTDASPTYISVNCSETLSSISLEKIMVQKHLALFINIEAWTDWRRTGYPTLIANDKGDVAAIPRRYPTVMDERTYNPNAIVVSDILKPIWWDTAGN